MVDKVRIVEAFGRTMSETDKVIYDWNVRATRSLHYVEWSTWTRPW